MTEIDTAPSVPDTIESVVLPSTELASAVTPLFSDDIVVLSPDTAFASKLHMHDNETGQIVTQLNAGSSIDWETTLDLRVT
jgi:hypothetical protein